MALYNIANKELHALEKTTFTLEGLQERYDLQEAIKKNIDIIAPDCLVISEEFSGNDSNLLIVFYVQIMPDDFVMQLHRF